jgi:hypothetical protein
MAFIKQSPQIFASSLITIKIVINLGNRPKHKAGKFFLRRIKALDSWHPKRSLFFVLKIKNTIKFPSKSLLLFLFLFFFFWLNNPPCLTLFTRNKKKENARIVLHNGRKKKLAHQHQGGKSHTGLPE